MRWRSPVYLSLDELDELLSDADAELSDGLSASLLHAYEGLLGELVAQQASEVHCEAERIAREALG